MRLTGMLAAGAALAAATPATPAPRLTVDRVVMLMRHGVRPPTKAPPLPAAVAPGPWPSWPVPPGWLTPHGARAIALLGADDRRTLARARLLPASGCARPGAVSIVSDSDQRTIATGDAYLRGLAPGCPNVNRHHAQDDPDPLFATADDLDAARANAAVARLLGPGGIAAAEARERPALDAIARIYCDAPRSACGITAEPSGLVPAHPGKRPKLTGALDLGSTAAQILLLEYAEGKPMADVGNGRATAADIALVGRLHAAEFALLARPRPIAIANVGAIARMMLATLRNGPARLLVIVGHDSQVASLAGLLDLHWQVPGLARDDPAPGGALGFELLHDARGRRFVRAFYRAQGLDQTRWLRAGAVRRPLAIPGCATACPLDRFAGLLLGRG